ncbi:MAG: PD-(D/E)XK nuclease family protein [Armatimonadota bacterium]|nr:PD-(D/E)XK nuclease family protein [Armatimonadota bacterium]
MLIKPRRESNPRKLVLSPTKIATYLACPLMYKYMYITKIGRFYYKPKAGHSFGASMHRALQTFHEHGAGETQTVEQLADHLRETWVAIGYESVAEEQESLTEGVKMLEEYYSAPPVPGTVTIFTERQLRQDMGEFVLLGRIDRLDQHTDGTLEIIDYKSGREDVTEDEVRHDLAMSIYQLLTKSQYPNDRVTASILCLRTGVKATVEMTAEELAAVENDVRAVAGEILAISEDTEFEPTEKDICPICDFEKLCIKIRAQNS